MVYCILGKINEKLTNDYIFRRDFYYLYVKIYIYIFNNLFRKKTTIIAKLFQFKIFASERYTYTISAL